MGALKSAIDRELAGHAAGADAASGELILPEGETLGSYRSTLLPPPPKRESYVRMPVAPREPSYDAFGQAFFMEMDWADQGRGSAPSNEIEIELEVDDLDPLRAHEAAPRLDDDGVPSSAPTLPSPIWPWSPR